MSHQIGAEVLRLKRDIGQMLDDSAALSLLERATLRMEWLRILGKHDLRAVPDEETLYELTNLLDRLTLLTLTS